VAVANDSPLYLLPHCINSRGVATRWTRVDMFTPVLPKVVHEIDANPVSFYGGGGSWSCLELDLPVCKYGE